MTSTVAAIDSPKEAWLNGGGGGEETVDTGPAVGAEVAAGVGEVVGGEVVAFDVGEVVGAEVVAADVGEEVGADVGDAVGAEVVAFDVGEVVGAEVTAGAVPCMKIGAITLPLLPLISNENVVSSSKVTPFFTKTNVIASPCLSPPIVI